MFMRARAGGRVDRLLRLLGKVRRAGTVLPMGRVDMGHEDLSVRWLQSLKSEMSSWISNVSS